jgi:Uma2 family endonuclease
MGANEQPLLLKRHLITVDEYYLMAEAGVLGPEARVELIEGEIIDKAPQKSRHAFVVNSMMRSLVRVVGASGLVTCQTPLRLSKRTEPEPDLMVLCPRDDQYGDAHPSAQDVLLLVEVADSSARYDRQIKLPLYARYGVSAVWIMDLDAGLVRMHSRPDGDAYLDTTATKTPGLMALPGLPGLQIDLTGLFSPAANP